MVLIVPLGLFTIAVALDIIYMASGRGGFATAAGYVIGTGLVAGLAASVWAFAAWLTVPRGTRARRSGMWHSGGNVLVLMLFTASWLIRLFHSWVPDPAALVCGLAGLGLAGLTGWLGGDLVERLRTGRSPPVAIVPRQQLRE